MVDTGSALATKGLTKSFRGKLAVENVSLSVNRGEIVGFLGPNGAGKTTVMTMVMGLLSPDAGSIELLGVPDGAARKDILMRIGFLQEKPRIYPDMSARAYLSFFARLYGLDDSRRHVTAVLARVGLEQAADRTIGTFSRGMQQRVCLARVLLHQPELLILDEPTLGLDPEGVAEMRTIFRDMREQGVTLLFSSHQLAEMERVCDSVIFMKAGCVVAAGRQADLLPRLQSANAMTVEIHEDAAKAARAMAGTPGWLSVREAGSSRLDIVLDPALTRDARSDRALVARAITAAGFTVLSVGVAQPTLEDLFLDLTSDGRHLSTAA